MSHCFIHGATESEGLSVRDVSKARFWGQRGAQAAVAAPRSFRRCTGAGHNRTQCRVLMFTTRNLNDPRLSQFPVSPGTGDTGKMADAKVSLVTVWLLHLV